jgi:hypothetical protein
MVFEGNAKQLSDPNLHGFKCYYDYCSRFTNSNKLLEKLKANDQPFKDFL